MQLDLDHLPVFPAPLDIGMALLQGLTGKLRADLVSELNQLSENLSFTKLGDLILNAARLAESNAKMASTLIGQ